MATPSGRFGYTLHGDCGLLANRPLLHISLVLATIDEMGTIAVKVFESQPFPVEHIKGLTRAIYT